MLVLLLRTSTSSPDCLDPSHVSVTKYCGEGTLKQETNKTFSIVNCTVATK